MLTSCGNKNHIGKGKSQYPEAITFTDSIIPDVRSLDGRRLAFPELPEPLTIVQQGRFIYLVNSDRTKSRISAYTKDGKWLADFLSRGRGPGEALGGRYLYFSPVNQALVHTDFKQRKVLMYEMASLEDILEKIEAGANKDSLAIRPQKEIRLGNTPNWRSYPTTDQVVSLISTAENDPWIVTSDYAGRVIRSCGVYPELPEVVDDLFLSQIFQCNAVVDSSVGKMAVLYQNTDLIDIYDLQTGKRLQRKHGPSVFYPEFKCEKHGNTYPVFSINGQTRDAYFVCVERGDLIWASYSGNTVSDQVQKIQHIYAFDWEGNPKMKFNLDRSILSFDVDPIDRIIYVLSYEEDGKSYIYCYDY